MSDPVDETDVVRSIGAGYRPWQLGGLRLPNHCGVPVLLGGLLVRWRREFAVPVAAVGA